MMLDRRIPFYNTILKCTRYEQAPILLPKGYFFDFYQPGYEKAWAQLEVEAGDFETEEEAECYFQDHYMSNIAELKKRGVFLLAPDGSVVGSCIAWQDLRQDKMVSSLHWLIVSEKHQGKGLGKALCRKTMEAFEELPVYIHTQPWSWKAIMLYVSLGFKLQQRDTFSKYVNQYAEAMAALKQILTAEQYEVLERSSDG